MLIFPVLLAVHAVLPQATPVRIADASCDRCHEKIYRSYLATPMANASGAAGEKLMPGTFTHQTSDIQYTIGEPEGKPTIAWRDLRHPGISGQFEPGYFLGSGHLGTTWVYSVDRYLFESPVAWYAASHGYDMKPGLEAATAMPASLPMQSGCLRCHMSAVQPSDPGTINRYTELAFLHTGITCEACHGDAARHVASGGKAAVVNPVQLKPELRDAVCISCHLEGDVTVERAGHQVLDYRPGQAIADYLAYYVYAKNNLTARGVSEVEQLSQSTCKRMSGDKMSCTSCHDPHYSPAPSDRVAFFRGKCLACHTGAEFARSHHPENSDCTSCHMPHNGAQNIPHVAWTDHRILRVREVAPVPAGTDVKNELVPIFSPGATDRDLGMAYYLALLEGNRAAEPEAWSLLQAQKQNLSEDKAALNALGILSVERGDETEAQAEFRRVIMLDPTNLTSLSNLGTLLAKEGKLTEAARVLHQAFDPNRDVAGLAMNLARVECTVGDGAAVKQTLQSAIIYNPNVLEMRQLLDRASTCGGLKLQDLKP